MKPCVPTETTTPLRQAAADREPETLSVAEAAERAGISRTLIYEALSSRLCQGAGLAGAAVDQPRRAPAGPPRGAARLAVLA